MRIHELPDFKPPDPPKQDDKVIEGVITQLPTAKAKDYIDIPDDTYEEDDDEVLLGKAIKHLSNVVGLLDAVMMSECFAQVFESADQKEVIDTIIDVNQFLMDFPDLGLE